MGSASDSTERKAKGHTENAGPLLMRESSAEENATEDGCPDDDGRVYDLVHAGSDVKETHGDEKVCRDI